jgi:hypothetical protein
MPDLSPLVVDRVEKGGRSLVLTPPIELEPEMDSEIGQYLVVGESSIGLDVSGRTRDELLDELETQLFYLWDTFALGDPATMTRKAAELGSRLRQRIQEVERLREVLGDA